MPGWLHIALIAFVEVVFLSATLFCVYRAQKSRIYPAFWQLLIFLLASDLIFLVDSVVRGLHLINAIHAYEVYFYTYWICFGIQALLTLRVLHEMFRHAMRSVPGMQRLGRPIFFWAVAVSVILACASGMTAHDSSMGLLLASAQILMRSESILALCLLTFLAFASHAMGISFGSRIFGVIFGFGLMAAADLTATAFFAYSPHLASTVAIVNESVHLAAFALWSVYFLRPEPVRQLVAVPVNSPLMRWNEIAERLGNPAGQVAVSYSPSFMSDVFHLVNSVMGPAKWPGEAAAGGPPRPGAS
jgi:hypothetical protein